MKIQHAGILMLMLVMAGCQTSQLTSEKRDLATFTRTGAIHDIRIGETIIPAELTVRLGDEVRWVNGRSASGQLVFTESLRDRVSCQNKFSGRDSTKVNPNEYVSLCFSVPGTYKYIARMGSPVPGGEMNLSGILVVHGDEPLPLVDTQSIPLRP
jgi:plastocyanin